MKTFQGRRDEENLAFVLDVDRCPAEIAGSMSVMVKNNLAVCVGCEGGQCPAETSGSKAVVMKNNLAFVLDVKKVPIRRPKSPDLTPSWPKAPAIKNNPDLCF